MHRLLSAFIAAAMILVAPACALGGGSYTKKPPVTVAASTASSLPAAPQASELTASQILGGCGGRRTRDPVTHKCRGPADFGN
jgi:hypothetical protein